MEVLTKALALAMAGSALALVVKKSNPELSMLLTALCACAIMTLALRLLGGVLELLELAEELSGLSSAVFTPVLKCVGLGVMTRLGTELCRDAGALAAASALEVCGCAAALCTALPLFRALLRMVAELG